MDCPHCQKPIPDKMIAKHLAAKGGSKSKRKLTRAQALAMVAARRGKGGKK
jgi:hypothetical protein